MLRKMTMLAMLLVLAFGTAAIAGCGGDDEKSSTKTETTKESDDSGGGGGGSTDPNIQAAVDSCKQAIDAQAQLKADTKDDLKGICDKAASGDIKDAQEASKEVCTKIVEDTVPSGDAQDQAKAACAQAAP